MPVEDKNLCKIQTILNPNGSKLPFLDRVKARYTIGLWNETLIDRTTVKGRIIHSLHNSPITKKLRQWTHGTDPDFRYPLVVAKALQRLTRDQIKTRPPTQQKEICDIVYPDPKARIELDEEFMIGVRQLENLMELEELPTLEEPDAKELHWAKDPKMLSELSYLSPEDAPVDDMNIALMNTLFGSGSLSSMPRANKLFAYVSKAIAQVKPDVVSPLRSMIANADDNDRLLSNTIKAKREVQCIGSRSLDGLKEIAQATIDSLRQLKPNESHLIFGGCPARPPQMNHPTLGKNPIVEEIFHFFDNDADTLTDLICERMMPIIAQHTGGLLLEENRTMLQQVMHQDLVGFFCPILTQSFLENRTIMEKILLSPVELVRKGAEKALRSFAEEATTIVSQMYTELFTKDGILKELKAAYGAGNLQENVRDKLRAFLKDHMPNLRVLFMDKLHEVASLVPPVFLDLLQSNGVLEIGSPNQHIWLEFVAQKKGKYTLCVYAAGRAATLHPVEERKGQVLYQVPLVIPDLTLEKLDCQFFSRLYSFIAWPTWHDDVKYQPSDIYKWLKASLDFNIGKASSGTGTEATKTDGEWAVLQLLINHHVQFPTERERKLFYFNLKKQVLIDAWAGIRGNLDKDIAGREAVRTNVRLLSLEALKLYRKGILDLDTLQRLYATRVEINKAIEAVELAHEEILESQGLIPKDLMPHLEGLFSLATAQNADHMKDLLVGVLGDEVEEVIDSFVEKVVPKELKNQNVQPPLKSRSKRILNLAAQAVLGLKLDDFTQPSIGTIFRVALLVTRIALSILFPQYALHINLGFAVTVVAIRAIHASAYRYYPEKMEELQRWKRRSVARTLAKILLGTEQLKHFEALIKCWKAIISRSGKISYDLARDTTSNQKVRFKVAAIKVDTPLQANADALRGAAYARFPNVAPALQPRKEIYSAVSPSRIQKRMEEWFNWASRSNDNDTISRYINGQLKNLPVPYGTYYWVEVPNPQGCIRAIIQLMHLLSTSTTNAQHLFRQQVDEININMFRCYAIIDMLARKCPEAHLEGYGVNPWTLAFWSHNAEYRQYDRQMRNDLIAIKRYFRIDPDRVYTEDDVQDLADMRKSLFYNFNKGKYGKVRSKVEFRSDKFGTRYEKEYYEMLLQDPIVRKKLKIQGIALNDSTNAILAIFTDQQLDESSVKSGEDLSVYGDNPHKSLLPPPFADLRRANYLVHSTMTRAPVDDLEDTNIQINQRDNSIRQAVNFLSGGKYCPKEYRSFKTPSKYKNLPLHFTVVDNPFVRDVTQRNLIMPTEAPSGNMEQDLRHLWTYESGYVNGVSRSDMAYLLTNTLHNQARSQIEIINNPRTFSKTFEEECHVSFKLLDQSNNGVVELHKTKRKLLEMLWEHKSGQVMHALAFFAQNSNLFFDNKRSAEFLFLFQILLFSDDLLHRQLEEEPRSSVAIGEFFANLLIDENITKKPHVCLALIEFGIFAKAEVIMNGGNTAGFPNFRAILYRMLPEVKNCAIAGLLALPYHFLDPRSLNIQEHHVEDICTAMLESEKKYDTDGGTIYGLRFQDHELDSIFLHVLAAWVPHISTRLQQDQQLRNRVLSKIAHRLGLLASDRVVTWVGNYPLFKTGAGIEIDFEYKRTDIYDAPIRNKIREVLSQIFGTNMDVVELMHRQGQYHIASEDISITPSDIPQANPQHMAHQQLIFSKLYQNRTYYWMRPETENAVGNTTYWVSSVPEDGLYDMIILSKGKVKERKRVRTQDAMTLPAITAQAANLEIMPAVHKSGDKIATKVDLSQTPHQLGFLTWFQPITHIEVFRSSEMQRIEFTNLKIAFNLEQHKGELQAVSDGQFPGFYIAKDQRQEARFPVLKHHTRYLLLENGKGGYQVILPMDSPAAPGVSWLSQELRLLNLSSEHKALLELILNQVVQYVSASAIAQVPAMHTYTIDETDGRLYSTDPLAILHLLIFNFAKESAVKPKDRTMAETAHYLKLFEVRGRTDKRFSNVILTICHAVEAIAVFTKNPELLAISLRMAAIRLRNTLLNPITDSPFDERSFLGMTTALMYAAYQMSLRYPTRFPNLQINSSQKEWLNDAVEDFAESHLVNLLNVKEGSLLHGIIKQVGKSGILQIFSLLANAVDDDGTQLQTEIERLLPMISRAISECTELAALQKLLIYIDLDRLNMDATWATVPISFEKLNYYTLCDNFHIYYRLARNAPNKKLTEPQKKEFKERAAMFKRSLHSLHGKNFDEKGNVLIAYLRAATSDTILSSIAFPSPTQFDNSLGTVTKKQQELLQIDPKKDRDKCYQVEEELRLAKKERDELFKTISSACKARLDLDITTEVILPLAWKAVPELIKTPFKVVKTNLLASPSPAASKHHEASTITPSTEAVGHFRLWLSDLELEDTRHENVCLRFLADHFIPVEEDQKRTASMQEVPRFTSNSNDPSVQSEFKRLNEDLSHYYSEQAKQKPVTYQIKGREHLYFLQSQLLAAKDAFHKGIEMQKKQLVDRCQLRIDVTIPDNELIPLLVQEKLSDASVETDEGLIKGLIHAFAKDDTDWILSHTRLRTENEIMQLRQRIFRYLVKTTRLCQVERVLKILIKIIPLNLEDPTAKIYLQELTYELSRHRTYDLDGTCQKMIRELLVMEHAKKIMFWEKQTKIFQNVLTSTHSQLVWQAPTGNGKTDLEKGLTSFHKADGTQAPYIFFTDALVAEHSEQTSMNLFQTYGHDTQTTEITRRTPLKVRNLKAFLKAHVQAVTMMESHIGRKNDLLCMRALWIEVSFDYPKSKSAETGALFTHFARPIHYIRTHMNANIDEPQLQLSLKEELIHPKSKKKSMKKEYRDINAICSHRLVEDPVINGILNIRMNMQYLITKERYNAEIKPRLAEYLSHLPDFEIPADKSGLLREYLMGELKDQPAWLARNSWLEKSEHLEEINQALGVIRDELPEILQYRVCIDFDRSKDKRKKVAIPCLGNGIRNEKVSIKDPTESDLKTHLTFLVLRLEWSDAVDLIEYMKSDARAEMRLTDCEIDETIAGKTFKKWCKNQWRLSQCDSLMGLEAAEQQHLLSLINESNNAMNMYVREFAPSQFYKESIYGNAKHFAAMTKGFVAGTASPYSEGTLPPKAHVEWDKGSIGEVVDYIMKTCEIPEADAKEAADSQRIRPADSPPPIVIVEDALPRELLQKMLTSLFAYGSPTTMLVDGEGLFWGINSEEMGRIMFQHVLACRPDKQGVIYVSETHEKMVFQRGATGVQVLSQATIDPDDCLIGIDQIHAVGLSIDPKTVGNTAVITIGPSHKVGDAAQHWGRVRNSKMKKRLPIFFTTKSIQKLISGDSFPTMRQIVTFWITNQGQGELEENYRSVLKDMACVIQSSIQDRVTANPEKVDEGSSLMVAFKEFFVQEVEESPTKIFGRQLVSLDTREVLNALRKEYLSKLKASGFFNKEQRNQIRDQLNLIGTDRLLPPKVKVYLEGKKIRAHLADFGLMQQVFESINQNEDLNNLEEQQQETNINEQLNLHRMTVRNSAPKDKLRIVPAVWSDTIDYFANLHWLKLEKIKSKSGPHTNVHMFAIKDILAVADDDQTREVAHAFAGNLWWTNNYIGILDKMTPTLAEPLSKQQKPITEVLVTYEENEKEAAASITIGALSSYEADLWRKRIKANEDKNAKVTNVKIGLFNLALNTLAMSANGLTDKHLLTRPDFLMDLARMKFLTGQMNITINRAGYTENNERLMKWFMRWIDSNNLESMKLLFKDIQHNLRVDTGKGELDFLFVKKKFPDPLMQ